MRWIDKSESSLFVRKMKIETGSTKTEKRSPQPKDDAESSSGSSSHSSENSSSPTDESSSQINSCSCGKDKCMDSDCGSLTTMTDRLSEMKKTDETVTECMIKLESLNVKYHDFYSPDSKTFSRKGAGKSESSESKTSESCYPTSSSNCDSKPVAGYSKRNSKLCATKGQTLENKSRRKQLKKKSTKNSRKSKKLARTATILKRRKRNIWKNKMAIFSESNRKRKFSSVSNSSDCNFGCMNCGRHINMKRKRLNNRSVTATMSSEASSSVTTESVERSSSCISYENAPPENDSYFSEDCSNTRLSRRKSA